MTEQDTLCGKCWEVIEQRSENALDGTWAIVWSAEDGWVCKVDGNEHEPDPLTPERRKEVDAALDAERAQLAQEVADSVDLVHYFAGLDPDESGYGEPYAYAPETRALIRKCKALQERMTTWEGM